MLRFLQDVLRVLSIVVVVATFYKIYESPVDHIDILILGLITWCIITLLLDNIEERLLKRGRNRYSRTHNKLNSDCIARGLIRCNLLT